MDHTVYFIIKGLSTSIPSVFFCASFVFFQQRCQMRIKHLNKKTALASFKFNSGSKNFFLSPASKMPYHRNTTRRICRNETWRQHYSTNNGKNSSKKNQVISTIFIWTCIYIITNCRYWNKLYEKNSRHNGR